MFAATNCPVFVLVLQQTWDSGLRRPFRLHPRSGVFYICASTVGAHSHGRNPASHPVQDPHWSPGSFPVSHSLEFCVLFQFQARLIVGGGGCDQVEHQTNTSYFMSCWNRQTFLPKTANQQTEARIPRRFAADAATGNAVPMETRSPNSPVTLTANRAQFPRDSLAAVL